MSVLSVNNISKSYKDYSSEFGRVASWFGLGSGKVKDNWVLKNINFNVAPGEALGVAGQNGAGKSTLLKIITGTLRQTEGSVAVNGRIAAILELGMGFNPDFTGRQNAYNSLGMMGFTHQQIVDVIDYIHEFSEIGAYFDHPVRMYSSGMQARLAFGVATAYRPDILIVDEALSVGDAYFQHKSFSRIKEFRDQGTSLLLVSHDKEAIQSVCSRAILLDKGEMIKDGDPSEIMDYYNALIADKQDSELKINKTGSGVQTISGTGEAKVAEIAMYNSKGEVAEVFAVGEEAELRITVDVFSPLDEMTVGYMIKDRLGQAAYGTNTWFTRQPLKVKDGDKYIFSIKFKTALGVGSYSITTAVTNGMSHIDHNCEWRELAYVFEVLNTDKVTFEGHSWLPSDIEINKV